jgi:RHS repeat-associated protein
VLSYDAANRVHTVTVGGVTEVTMDYNALGQRSQYVVRALQQGVWQPRPREQFGYEHGRLSVVQVLQDDGSRCMSGDQHCTEVIRYRQDGLPLELLYTSAAGVTTPYWYVVDGRGDVIALTDKSGMAVDTYIYTTWGRPFGGASLPQPLRYRGYVWDEENHSYWLSSREYDPLLQRFLQPDPSEQDGVQSYVYCNDDPVDCADPSGLAGDPQEIGGEFAGGVAGEVSITGEPAALVGDAGAEPVVGTASAPDFYVGPDGVVWSPSDFYTFETGPAIPGQNGNRKVSAVSTVKGRVFVDTNQGSRPAGLADVEKPTQIHDKIAQKEADNPGKQYPNGDMAHAPAEVGTIQQAIDAGATEGEDMTMTVAGENVCPYCRSDVRDMAQRAGLRSLTIHELKSGDTLYWEPGMRTFTVRQ